MTERGPMSMEVQWGRTPDGDYACRLDFGDGTDIIVATGETMGAAMLAAFRVKYPDTKGVEFAPQWFWSPSKRAQQLADEMRAALPPTTDG